MNIKVLASGSTGNCYRIDDSKTALLLDAGIAIKQIRIGCNFRLSDISGCLITHYHGDHSKAVKDLLAAGVKVYMPKAEAEALKLQRHYRLHFLEKSETKGGYKPFEIGTFNIQPFAAEHDTPEPVGYLIGSADNGEKLAYFTDTFYLKWRLPDLTHIIGEVNYDRATLWEKYGSGETPSFRAKRLFKSHMSLENFLDFLRKSGCEKLRQIYICHMSDDHGNEAKIKEAVQKLTGAEVYIC